MANVNWQAYYPENANLIVQGNPALDMLRQKYAQHQQDRAANIKDFTGELAKLNFNGARDPDLPELQKDYGNILQSFQKYRTENDPKKQAELNLQMRQMQNQFLYKAQQSKQENEEFHKDAALAHNPNADLDPTYWDDMKKRIGTSTFDPKYQSILENKQNWMAPKGDPIKDAQEIVKNISGTTTTSEQRYNKLTGRVENVQSTSTDIPQDKFMKAWVTSHSNDPNKVKLAIRETGEQDPVKAVLIQGQKMYDAVSGGGKSGTKVSNGVETLGTKEALMDYNAGLKAKYPTFGQAQNLTPIYRQKWVNDMLTNVPESGEALKAKIAADPTYDGPLTIGHADIKGSRNIWITVPPKRKWNATDGSWEQIAPSREVYIDPKDPNAKVKLNELTNELTGEKVDISSLETPGGKKHVVADVKQPSQGGTVRFQINGKMYDIPKDKVNDLKKQYPNAKQL